MVNIAILQARAGSDPAANVAHARHGIEQAAARGADIVCTQELFRTPYFCQIEDAARSISSGRPVSGRLASGAMASSASRMKSPFTNSSSVVFIRRSISCLAFITLGQGVSRK